MILYTTNLTANVTFLCSATTGEIKHYTVFGEINGLSVRCMKVPDPPKQGALL